MRKSSSTTQRFRLSAWSSFWKPGYFYPIFLAFVETAAKTDEIIELSWDDVDFKRLRLYFRGGDALAERTLGISDELAGVLANKKPEKERSFAPV